MLKLKREKNPNHSEIHAEVFMSEMVGDLGFEIQYEKRWKAEMK